jgi:UDP-N-acetylglucosamine diphosphorylase / glucose-1-phosphate thymidylyltransferase / UDP-N-acetylgalactosamine diphosphorylase / glucosamine-1-phosphate N-acetyltransferase / galactosamine-1-phosphate N-acetyltransferase
MKHPITILNNLNDIVIEMNASSKSFSNATPLSSDASLFCEGKATIQPFVTFDGPIFLGENVVIGPYTFLRGPLYIGQGTQIGPYCEITRSFIKNDVKICHKNIIPDSVIGNKVILSGGVILCNFRLDGKEIELIYNNVRKTTDKFGAIIEDEAHLGVNVVAMPGCHIKSKSFILGPSVIKGVVCE